MFVEAILILTVMVVVSALDALRDRWVDRKSYIGWWKWHIVKWVAFYLPLVLLGYFYFRMTRLGWISIIVFLSVCLVCWVVWQVVYNGFFGYIER